MRNEIVIENVSKSYGEGGGATYALADVDLVVGRGEFLSVMGPSGSGKSTLLNLMAGLDTPSCGRIVVADVDIGRMSDDERSRMRLETVGFIFQAFHLFPTFTIEENVAWPLEFLGRPWRQAQREAAAVLEQVDVPEGAWKRRPAELSGGEQQRVAVARALVTKPRILLADEPTGNLDSRTGKAILDLLGRLNSQGGLTVVLVTHSTFAATYGHRTIELRDGRIVHEANAPKTSARVIVLREG